MHQTENHTKGAAMSLNISVDCVLVGFDGEQLRVLLIRQDEKRQQEGLHNLKLPGSLIYDDEDLDDAAKRVLTELTGLKNVKMSQFKAYGSKDRTRNPKDVMWLERFYQLKNQVDRIVTIAYLALVKIDKRYESLSDQYDACWMPVGEVTQLAFDHLQILQDAIAYARQYVETNPQRMFDLLPRKFTVAQLRALFEVVYNKPFDVRNFHKRLAQMPYVVPLDEKEVGVNHRAARYYKFDRAIYKKKV
jgi:hypothetical protein